MPVGQQSDESHRPVGASSLPSGVNVQVAAVVLLWAIALAAAAVLAFRDYRGLDAVIPKGPGGVAGGFWIFLHAARQISAGHTIYDSAQASSGLAYVYTPLVALVLLPFCHGDTVIIWHVWTALSETVVMAALTLWWLLLFKVDWSPGLPHLSAARISVPFFANLVALTVSFVADQMSGAASSPGVHVPEGALVPQPA